LNSLVIQTAYLGDVVLTTPLIAAVAKLGRVDVLTTPAAAGLLANNPFVRTVIPYDKAGADAGLPGFMRMVSRLRAERYEAAYIAQASLRSGALALAAGIPKRVGFAPASGRMFYTKRVAIPEGIHASKRFLLLSGDKTADSLVTLFPGITERAAVDRLLSLHNVDDKPLTALAPGSVWLTKRWPYFPDLARYLGRLGHRVVVLGSEDDAPLAKEVCKAAGSASINAAGQLSLLASAELLRRCRVLVTNDSAPQHLASAVMTTTITVFGPTVPSFGYGPLAPDSESIGHEDLSCRPCHAHGPMKCPKGHWRCMLELMPETVGARVEHILSQPES
jgi:heptosyltransferase-2